MNIVRTEDPRVSKLTDFFNKVLHGRRSLLTARDGKLFVEAICVQADPATCVHKLWKHGLSTLQAAVRFDTSVAFLNNHAAELLEYLQDPSLRAIGSGSILAQLLLKMVDPTFFWDALVEAFTSSLLNPKATQGFAWLLLQLVSLPDGESKPYLIVANSPNLLDTLLKAPEGEVRILGQKIKHALPLDSSQLHQDLEATPGGRHDNDHEDRREISIMPTADELLSSDRPFFRTVDYLEDPDKASLRDAIHLDNQFRVLREDMLGDIRDELKMLTGKKPGRHRGIVLEGLSLSGVETGTERKRMPWGIVFKTKDELPHLKKIKPSKREDWLKRNKNILKHGNMACLLIGNEPVAFPTIHRDIQELAKGPAAITLQFADDSTLLYALSKIKNSTSVKLVQLDTAVFAYEPFLRRLQEMKHLPLKDELLLWGAQKSLESPAFCPGRIVELLISSQGNDIGPALKTNIEKSIVLDESQMLSLCSALSQRVSLVQGPPGTGKSFIGALTAKLLHTYTTQKILVICFTNHSLDQFLEDLMDIGIPQSDIVRLGSKSTDRTKPLTLREQPSTGFGPKQRSQMDTLRDKLQQHDKRLRDTFRRFKTANIQKKQLMEYLEFLSKDLPFFDAFWVPENETDGMTKVGKKGKAMGPFYLLDRWQRGASDAGALQESQPLETADVWKMPLESRHAAVRQWQTAILDDMVKEIQATGRQFNKDQAELDRILGERDNGIIKTKRIIACTTNGAARYFAAIQEASPGIVLVEEAGEILESHILTSLGPSTEQLILIGDHKQLRPKCSYNLSVEQGDGFDLNRSLFERLILQGFPHTTLTKQHRMRPEISSIIRHLDIYPDLTDADSTLQRADLRGFRDNVMFVNHSHPEVELGVGKELYDGRTSSKQNEFEVQMILKCVRYLAQQGYSSDKLVVLTPYLGQLLLLKNELAESNDPILNDLDKFDLIRAGLLTDVSSGDPKPSLRISTIDNYQGEESDIVLVSMTRSNKSHDIGFMASPERVNVLLSRARDALIMIGNSDTFINARKGKEVWQKLFGYLKQKNHVYEGFPLKCEKHNRPALISKPEDFDAQTPDGGCREPCGVKLKCGLHDCPSSCHQLYDHSKMRCIAPMKRQCPNKHIQKWLCHAGVPAVCSVCEREKKAAEASLRKAVEEQMRRDEKVQKHLKEVAKIEEEIEKIKQQAQDEKMDSEQNAVLAQKRKDLQAAKARADAAQAKGQPQSNQEEDSSDTPEEFQSAPEDLGSTEASKAHALPKSQAPATKRPREKHSNLRNHIKEAIAHNKSASKTEWQRQKDQDQENAQNPAIDKIMEMIGLEEVKAQVLRIKAKVETSIRQGTDLKKERLGLVLLGNPGTGKTTVARHYAQILTSLKVLQGDGFVETTGSRLAHEGVNEVKKHFDELEKSEGGVYFIDEAYQLAEGHNYGGKTVLDYLLAEIENLTGKVVFVFAGYRKQMEKFFEQNPGFASRIPYTFHFEDYTDPELLTMLQFQMSKYYKSGIDIEDGVDGLYMRIAVRRLGRGRGRDGFGNARALENLFAKIRDRQADRLTKERREGLQPDDLHMTKEDLIGPDPSHAIITCDAWTKLQRLTGLKSVKDSVKFLIDNIQNNYKRELNEKELVQVSLNRCFLGSPGTGKTTVAKLYGKILTDLGLLSNGEVVVKNPADFIGSAIGQSEANTKAILANTVGKVLIIDEAYMIYSGAGTGGAGGTSGADTYKTSVIDTLVAEIQSVPGEDRCVLLLGYEPQMVEMFQNVNPGLTRRFPLSSAFRFEDFDNDELQEILEYKLKSQDLDATPEAISTAIGVLDRLRNGLNFGNGGDVENLLSRAKENYQARQSRLPVEERAVDIVFEPQDFDPEFDRGSKGQTNLHELFQGVIGCEAIIAKLDGFLKVVKGMQVQGLDPRGQIPMNFIFKGPPGTGKTSTARKFGQVYYDLGFLSKAEVIECSATDLVGQYVGQTGPKTIKQLERGLGKVLFIDEAYRLGQGHFAQEAMDQLVDSMTKPQFAEKMVIILAGYENDMNNLLRVNEGLSSRFADEISFPSLSPSHCLQILAGKLNESRISLPSAPEDPNRYPDEVYKELLYSISEMSRLPSWGNARDTQTLAKSMVRAFFQGSTSKADQLVLPAPVALDCTRTMLAERRARAKISPSSRPSFSQPVQILDDKPSAPQTSTATTATMNIEEHEPKRDEELPQSPGALDDPDGIRDAGVSDAVWQQLQKDKKEAELREQRALQRIQEQEEAHRRAEEAAREAEKVVAELREKKAKDEAERQIILRLREEARILEEKAKAEKERVRQELERRTKLEAERRKKLQEEQKRLMAMGRCPMGYAWIKQNGGYRCAGGSHWVPDGQLGF